MFNLDSHQQSAIDIEGNLLVTACPGSGKSRLLSSKAAKILDDGSSRVCAVSFTRDAATELKVKIKSQCQLDPHSRLQVGTFHSLGLWQLRNAGIDMKVMSEGASNSLIKHAYNQLKGKGKLSLKEAFNAISFGKSCIDNPFRDNEPKGRLLAAYQKLLEQMKTNDFADILYLCVKMMQEGNMSPLAVDTVLVDESQDSDSIQLEWILQHAKAGCRVLIVGDDDQSIYGWRNALGYRGMKTFQKNCNASHVSLDINYRCCPVIINHATTLIARNVERVPKSIVAHRTDEGDVKVIRAMDQTDEAQKITKLIEQHRESSWGILARTNHTLHDLEVFLSEKNIPFIRVGGKSFWETEEASTLQSLLQSLIGKKNNQGWISALVWAGMPTLTVDSLVEAVTHSGKMSWEGFEVAAESEHVRARLNKDLTSLKLITGLVQRRREWQQTFDANRIRLGLAGVVRWMEVVRPRREPKDIGKEIRLLKSVKQAIGSMKHPTLKERLHILFVKQLLKNKQIIDERISLMTVHGSKGLEFDNVVIVGCEKEGFPLEESKEDEERRLFYVGMTRACNNLYLSYTDIKGPSVFLKEAGLGVGD